MSDGERARLRRIVLTGGPGAGKTATLEVLRHVFRDRVAIVPESASILFRGGFPREATEPAECAAQRAIFHVQTELERFYDVTAEVDVLLCDRGTVDSVAYWPRSADDFWADLGTSAKEQLARYDVVIHLEPPAAGHGYHRDGVRRETASEAAGIDARIVAAWSAHPRRYSIPSTPHFPDKVSMVIELVDSELRGCGTTGPARRRAVAVAE